MPRQQPLISRKRGLHLTRPKKPMRQIDFTAAAPQLYTIALVAVQLSEPEKTAAGTRQIVRLLDALEGAGVADAKSETGFSLPADASLLLEDAEFTRLTALVEAAPILNRAAREKVKLMDLLAAAPTVKPQALENAAPDIKPKRKL